MCDATAGPVGAEVLALSCRYGGIAGMVERSTRTPSGCRGLGTCAVAARSDPARLMSFHGCGDELAALRKATEASVVPFGMPGVAGSAEGTAYPAAQAAAPTSAVPTAAPAYSGANNYQAGLTSLTWSRRMAAESSPSSAVSCASSTRPE